MARNKPAKNEKLETINPESKSDAAEKPADNSFDNITVIKRLTERLQYLEREVKIPNTDIVITVKSYRCVGPNPGQVTERSTRKDANEWLLQAWPAKVRVARPKGKAAANKMASAVSHLEEARQRLTASALMKGVGPAMQAAISKANTDIENIVREIGAHIAELSS